MLRELTKDESEALEALRNCPASASELAGPDVTQNTVEKLRKGSAAFTVAKLRAMYRILRRRDPEAALQLLAGALGLEEFDLVVHRAVSGRDQGAVETELLHSTAALGDLASWRSRGGSVEEGEELARRAEREVHELAHAVEGRSPQLQLVAGGSR